MKLTENEIFNNSFVLTTSNDKLERFYNTMLQHGFNIKPRPYFGRVVDRNSQEFRYNKHYIAAHGSHFEICEIAQKEEMPFVCIFEDDAYPCIDVHEKLNSILSNIPDDAYILKMGYVPFSEFKYKNQKLNGIESVIDSKYSETYLGGSHAYIIFKSFYQYSHEMYNRYIKLCELKDTKEIHNPMFFSSDTLKNLWLYEWLITPNVYKNEELQKHIYSINPNMNLFVQPAFTSKTDDSIKTFDFL